MCLNPRPNVIIWSVTPLYKNDIVHIFWEAWKMIHIKNSKLCFLSPSESFKILLIQFKMAKLLLFLNALILIHFINFENILCLYDRLLDGDTGNQWPLRLNYTLELWLCTGDHLFFNRHGTLRNSKHQVLRKPLFFIVFKKLYWSDLMFSLTVVILYKHTEFERVELFSRISFGVKRSTASHSFGQF